MPAKTNPHKQRSGVKLATLRFWESVAKFEFFENGWNPYSRFLDIDKVDLILRRKDSGRTIYREIRS